MLLKGIKEYLIKRKINHGQVLRDSRVKVVVLSYTMKAVAIKISNEFSRNLADSAKVKNFKILQQQKI